MPPGATMPTQIRSLALTIAILWTCHSTALAQDSTIVSAGAVEFFNSCSACHGTDARGSGPIANSLKVKPADLTQLAKQNQGAFPFLKVVQTIDGRSAGAHGSREMPVWGDRYQEQVGLKYGPYGGETVVRARILELVYYLQSVQQ